MEKRKQAFPISSSLQVGNLIFISGQVGIDPRTNTLLDTSFETEVYQIMENLASELHTYGLSLKDLISTTVYLKDMEHYAVLNEIYGSYFSENFPTRTCIAVANLPVNASVEISGIAYIRASE